MCTLLVTAIMRYVLWSFNLNGKTNYPVTLLLLCNAAVAIRYFNIVKYYYSKTLQFRTQIFGVINKINNIFAIYK